MADNSREDIGLIERLVGSISEMPQAVTQLACDLTRDLLGPGVLQAGLMIEDAIYKRHVRNRVKGVIAVAKLVQASGLDPAVLRASLPPGWALNVIEEMERVDDEDMRDLWARLLVAPVVDAKHEHPASIDLLRRMSPADASVFQRVLVGRRPTSVPSAFAERGWSEVPDLHDRVRELERLEALQLIRAGNSVPEGTPRGTGFVALLPLGRQLGEALGLPTTSP